MQTAMRSAIVMITVVALSVAIARAAEEKIYPSDLPKSVAESLNARFPGLKINSAVRETDSEGRVVYDVELNQNGRRFETDIENDGTMLEVEKQIMKRDWSRALNSTVGAKYPKGKITEVLEVNKVIGGKEVPDHLEVTIETSDKREAEMLVSLDGKTETHEASGETSPPAASAEEDVKPADLPSVVRNALKSKFPQAEIKSAEKGTEDGKPIFEVSIKNEHHDIDVTLSPAGEILSFEKTLKMNDRPKPMKESLAAKFPHASIKLIEEVWEHGKLTGYEGTLVTADKKKVDVTFNTEGKLIEDKN